MIREYPVPTSNFSSLQGITTGPDGALWFCEYASPGTTSKIGRITTLGALTEFTVPVGARGFPGVHHIKTGPDGALWFTELIANQIGRITTAGVITEYPVPTATSFPYYITLGPDGALWFTEYNGNKIGRITTAGVFTEFAVTTSNSSPGGIALGSDGALWFTEFNTNKIARITTAGLITEYPLPTPDSKPFEITAGPDGALWFTEYNSNKVGRITTAGDITEYPVISVNSHPQSIVTGSDGAVWFTEAAANNIGRITTTGSVSEYPIPTANGQPNIITAGPDGALWFTEYSGNNIGSASPVRGFTPTASMQEARLQHTATLLKNGTVLVTGGSHTDAFGNPITTNSAEIYSPRTGTWRYTGVGQQTTMTTSRFLHTATKLADGRVLLAGGYIRLQPNSGVGGYTPIPTNTAEIFDPATETFTLTGPLNSIHTGARAVLLNDGRVMVVGESYSPTGSEIYDPSLGTWSNNVPAVPAGYGAAVGILPNGDVFIADGDGCCGQLSVAALYTPATNTLRQLANLLAPRSAPGWAVLPNGQILIVGGYEGNLTSSSTELYDTTVLPNGQSQSGPSLNQSRSNHTTTVLPNGDVLVAGGAATGGASLSSAELRNHATGSWAFAAGLSMPRADHTATLLPSGAVLIAGGSNGTATSSAEIWGAVLPGQPNELYWNPLYNDPSLISYWRFEGDAADSKGGNNGTGQNVTYGPGYGKFGQGVYLNGNSTRVAIPDSVRPESIGGAHREPMALSHPG